MAIISGGRINLWNAVKKQFEVVHPETEVARITDFADGIVQKLALTSAMTAVTALQTDSWFGKLLKMALTASGVKYSIAQNGYVCLGNLFGGLIIQWGISNMVSNTYTNKAVYPIAFPKSVYETIPYDTAYNYSSQAGPRNALTWLVDKSTNSYAMVASSATDTGEWRFIAIGN